MPAALLELAEEKHALDAVSGDLVALGHMIADSSDLQKLISSPLMDRADQARAIGAVAKAAGFGDLTQRFVGPGGGEPAPVRAARDRSRRSRRCWPTSAARWRRK